jgi:hypothetical protein
LAVDLGAVAHGLIELEPRVRQRRAMQHQPINVYEPAAARAFNLGDGFGQLRVFCFFD